jgi:hypothetical protein
MNYTLDAESEMPNMLGHLHQALRTCKPELIAKWIFNVLVAIWTVKWPASLGRLLVDPTIIHLALSMLEKDRSFQTPQIYDTIHCQGRILS